MPLFLILPIVYLICLALFCLHYWRRFRRANRTQPFNYRITDIWTAMLGLTPSLTLIATHYRAGVLSDLEPLEFWTLALLLAISQIVGLFIGRLHIELPPHHGARNAFESAVSILTGALLGLLILVFLPLFIGIMFFVCFSMLGVLFSALGVPVLLLALLLLVVYWITRDKGKRGPPYFPRRKDGRPGNGS